MSDDPAADWITWLGSVVAWRDASRIFPQ